MSVDADQQLSTLLAAHGAALTRLAASYVRDPGERDDLFQDIVIAIWRALPRFRGDCSERTFVFRIAHNRGLAYATRRRLVTTGQRSDEEPVDVQPTPEATLSALQQRQRLLGAIRRLPLTYRQVVTLTLEGFSYRDIADVLGISENNVGARLTRARQMLRVQLSGLANGTR
jgi:RNA polymerase sigma-70 factor (ECF subfamily)